MGETRLALCYRPRTPINISGYGLRSRLAAVPGAYRIAVPHCGCWGGLVLSSQARFNLVGGCFPHPREIVSANDVMAGHAGGLLHRLGELSGITGDVGNRLGRHHAGVRITIFPRTHLSLGGRLRRGPIETGDRLSEMQRCLGGHGVWRGGIGPSRRTALALERPRVAEERRDQSEKA